MTADDERPAVWVIDPDDPSGATRHPGREHGRFVDDRGEHVIVLFDRGTVRDYRVVSPERVVPRGEDEPVTPGGRRARERATCRDCGKSVAVDRHGRLMKHSPSAIQILSGLVNYDDEEECIGSRELPSRTGAS